MAGRADNGEPAGGRERLLTPGFLLLTIAGLCYFLAAGIVVPVLPHFITRSLGGGSLAVGIVVGAFAVSAVMTRPTAGRLGNRLGRRRLMIGGALVAGLSIAAYGLAPNTVVLAVLRLVTGVGEGMFFTGSATLVADMAPPERRGEALSYYSVAVYVGTGVGPAIGQVLSDHVGAGGAFGVAGLTSLLGAAISLRVPDTLVIARSVGRQPLFNRKALGPGAVLALGLMGFTAFQAYVPLYADRLRLGGSQYVFLLYAAVVVSVRTVGARLPDRLGPSRSGTAATLAIAAGFGIVAAVGNPIGLYSGAMVIAVGMSLQYPALMAMAVNRAEEHERAAVVGTFTAAFDLAQGAGGFVLGGVAAAAGYRASFAGGGVCALLGLALLRLRVAPPAGTPERHDTHEILAEPDAWAPPGFD